MGRRWENVVRGAATVLGRLPRLSDEMRNFADFHALSRSTTLDQVQSLLQRGMSRVAGHDVPVSLAPNVDVLQARRLAMDQLVLARFHQLTRVGEVHVDYRFKQQLEPTTRAVFRPAPGSETAAERGEPADGVLWYDAHRLTPQAGDQMDREGRSAADTGHSSEAARFGLAHLVAHESGHAAFNEVWPVEPVSAAMAQQHITDAVFVEVEPEIVRQAQDYIDNHLQEQRKALAKVADDDLVVMERNFRAQSGLLPPAPGRTGAEVRADETASLDQHSQGEPYRNAVGVAVSRFTTGEYAGTNMSERNADSLAEMSVQPEASDDASRAVYGWYQEARGRSAKEVPVDYMKYDRLMVSANEQTRLTPEYQEEAAQKWSGPLPGPTPPLPAQAPGPAALGLAAPGAPGGQTASPGPAPDPGQALGVERALDPEPGP
ncbi:hypothetical protein OG216_22725 [Streptomycetaceae bacterium NBC_01309]